ncbi:MAG: hypothetical protein FJX76_19035, partial [Armatimonadetes bacterium]|nr:hypothetical protein [Armatimonadota bacterium]
MFASSARRLIAAGLLLVVLLAGFCGIAAAGPEDGNPYSPGPYPTPSYPPQPLPTTVIPPPHAEAQAPIAPVVEGRGIWIEMKTLPRDPEGVRKVVRSLARCHFNFLLVEVTYEGAALYPSSLTQQDPRFAGVDVLQPLIEEAHRLGIEVHAWIWVMKQSRWRENDPRPGGPILALHPEWTALNKEGRAVSPGSSYYWLCPSRPEVRGFLLGMMEELVARYPLDGIHLDYIRYDKTLVKGAPPPYCFCDHCRQEYRRGSGVDPITIEPFTAAFANWEAWRENLINSLIGEAAMRVKGRRAGVVLSAAVYPDPDNARRYFGQDWTLWVTNRWLDFVTPMLYRDQTDGFARLLARYVQLGVTRHTVLLPGVGVNEIKNRLFSHDVLIEQVLAARAQGMLGTVLFSYSVMTPYFEQFLINKAFPKPAQVPFRNLADAAGKLVHQAADPQRIGPASPLGASGTALQPGALRIPVGDPAREALWLNARAEELEIIRQFHESPLPYQPATPPPLPIIADYTPPPQATLRRFPPGIVPRVDGGLSDPAWKNVPAFLLDTTSSGSPATRRTAVRMATDGKTLFIAFACS